MSSRKYSCLNASTSVTKTSLRLLRISRVETFEKFLSDVKGDKLEPYMKSEAIPDNTTPLKTAVAKNFDEVVINNDKDTLIEFYAPWCGHCKKLGPVFEEVANALRDEDVAIVKMDATANDVPSKFEVRGFPTLYWLSKDDKGNHVRYEVSIPLNMIDFSFFLPVGSCSYY